MPCLIERVSSVKRTEEGVRDWRELGGVIAPSEAVGSGSQRRGGRL